MKKQWVINLAIILVGLAAAWWWYQSRLPRFNAGQQAPDFTATLTDGKPFQLSQLKGRVTLLHFWGSWCGPCRRENKHLAKIYHQYRDRDFEIVSIGIDDREAAWKGAIEKDQLVWPYHTSTLDEFDNPVAQMYNVKQIPTTFLINRDGQIIGVNLSPDMLDKMLSEQLPN